MLQRLREKAEAEGVGNIKYILGAAGQGILSGNRYDCVFLVTVLGEIPDKVAALKEIFDSLKVKGTLSVTEVIADPHFLRQNTVRHLAKSVGFVEKGFF
jgi:ubiquinone/menaquinone biosynthesis C-methylase UbiE